MSLLPPTFDEWVIIQQSPKINILHSYYFAHNGIIFSITMLLLCEADYISINNLLLFISGSFVIIIIGSLRGWCNRLRKIFEFGKEETHESRWRGAEEKRSTDRTIL